MYNKIYLFPIMKSIKYDNGNKYGDVSLKFGKVFITIYNLL